MSKSKKELNELRIEYETLTKKLGDLSEDELNQVTGGDHDAIYIHGLEVIAPYASSEYHDWNSDKEVLTEPGHYKIG